MHNKNQSLITQDKGKTRKLIFWECQVATGMARLNSTRAIYLKYSLKLMQIRVKSTTAAVKWEPCSSECIFLFVVLRNFKKYILCSVKYTFASHIKTGTKLTTNTAYGWLPSSYVLKTEFIKKTKYNICASATKSYINKTIYIL